jgi:hypothetical protein
LGNLTPFSLEALDYVDLNITRAVQVNILLEIVSVDALPWYAPKRFRVPGVLISQ